MRSYLSSKGPESNMTGVLIKRGTVDTAMPTGRSPCEDAGRKHGDTKEHQRLSAYHQKLRERGMEHFSPSQPTK